MHKDESAQKKGCDLCDEFIGVPFELQSEFLKNGFRSRTLARTSRAIAFAGLGPLSLGYALVSPISHTRRLADLDAISISEIDYLCAKLVRILEHEFGSATCFEHGSRRKGGAGSCHDHAHLHVVAGRPNLRETALRVSHEHSLERLTEIHNICGDWSDYLLLSATGGGYWLYKSEVNLPSQIFRKKIAGGINYDWRLHPNYSIMKQTIDFYQARLAQDLDLAY